MLEAPENAVDTDPDLVNVIIALHCMSELLRNVVEKNYMGTYEARQTGREGMKALGALLESFEV
jgi:hypothetical protein